jgi:hypothetical protein
VVAAVSYVLQSVAPAYGDLRYGFPAYYTASRVVLDGEPWPRIYDDAWFFERSLQLTDGRVGELFRPNPPTAALLAMPVAGLDVETARRIWLLLDVLLVGLAIAALLAALPSLRSPPRAAALVALCLAWAPLRETVAIGQAYALVLALSAISLWAIVGDRHAVAGISVGLSGVLKLASIPLFVLLVVRGAWRSVVVAAGTAVVLAAVTLPFAGVEGWAAFARSLAGDFAGRPASLAVTAYQSATGLFQHLAAPDPAWNPGAIVSWPVAAEVASTTVSVVAIVATMWLGRRGGAALSVAAAVALGVLVLHVAQEYHFAVLLVPAAVAAARWFDGQDRGVIGSIWLGASLVLLAAPLPYKDPALADGWVALLAYPRLYGAWLLWGWLIRALWRERRLTLESTMARPTATMGAGPARPGALEGGDTTWPSSSSSS